MNTDFTDTFNTTPATTGEALSCTENGSEKARVDFTCHDVVTSKPNSNFVESSIQVGGIELSITGLVIRNENITVAVANELLDTVLSMHKSCNWLLGDTLLLMERKWGNKHVASKYEEASQATGYSIGTLRNMVRVCNAYPIEMRHADLSFSHHVEAACLSNDFATRESMLKSASDTKQSIKSFRKSIREHNAKPVLDESGQPVPEHIAHPELGENTDRPFGLIDLPERAAPGAPPLWDAMKFSDWVDKQEPETYTAEQCAQAIELTENIADFYERVLARLEELESAP